VLDRNGMTKHCSRSPIFQQFVHHLPFNPQQKKAYQIQKISKKKLDCTIPEILPSGMKKVEFQNCESDECTDQELKRNPVHSSLLLA
jgi:hypothetical protein